MSSRRSRRGGSREGDHVEAVVQVLAELALGEQLVDVPVGRRHQPDVERDQLLAPEPAHLPLLEDAEQVDLGLGGHLADLVEEQRAALRHLEPAGLLAHRAAERPLLVAEHLALDERLGQRPDVGGDERPVAAAAEVVDGPRDQLLARAALPLDQDGEVGVGDLADAGEDLADRGALADHLRELARCRQPRAEPAVLLTQAVVLEGPADLEPQHLQVDRLGDVVVRPQPHRLDGRLDRAVGGDHQDQGLRPAVLDVSHQVQTRERARHLQVGDHELVGQAAEQVPGLGPILCRRDLVRFLLQGQRQPGADVRLVVHDQDAEGCVAHV